MAWRYIAQRAVSGEFLDYDLPLEVSELSWALSSAGALKATIAPEIANFTAADGRPLLEEWSTFLYAEEGGVIRWGGIVVSSTFDDETWTVEASGFACYPHGIPYLGSLRVYSVDPTSVVEDIWRHIQSFPDGNLGVEFVRQPTPVRIGQPPYNGAADEPYELVWWEAPDCGAEIQTLADTTPFDFVEEHEWDGDNIAHRIRTHYPRVGRRRTDLAFVQGDNVTNVVSFMRDGDDYANTIVGLGAGEGELALRRVLPERDGRLRRTHVYSAKDVSNAARLDALIRSELQARRGYLEVTSLDLVDHDNARIGSWELGDDILVSADAPWLGRVEVWCRVVGWALTGEHTASLSLVRSDSFI